MSASCPLPVCLHGLHAQQTHERWGVVLSAAAAAQGAGDRGPLSGEECWQPPTGCVALGKSPNLSVPLCSSGHVGLTIPTVHPLGLPFLVCVRVCGGRQGSVAGARTRLRGLAAGVGLLSAQGLGPHARGGGGAAQLRPFVGLSPALSPARWAHTSQPPKAACPLVGGRTVGAQEDLERSRCSVNGSSRHYRCGWA